MTRFSFIFVGQRFDQVKRPLDDENNGSDDAPKSKIHKLLEESGPDASDHIELNSDLSAEQFVNDLTKCWSINEPLDSFPSVRLTTKPFQLCVIQNFLHNPDHIPMLLTEMLDCEWTNKQMDLYEFHQTVDLNTATSTYLQQFYTFLNRTVLPWIQQLTGLNLTHVSASCSMYNAGDHLLVHDDLLGDRKIAYVFYLSPWTDWTESMGGSLELFTCNEHIQPIHPPVQKIFPKNNQFVFFKVSEKSFHQVGEVTNYDYPRITINGWFHGPSKENQLFPVRSKSPEYVVEFISPTRIEGISMDGINAIYLQHNCKRNIQKHIEDKSEISLESFLNDDNYRAILQHLRQIDESQWIHQGPAHYRNYHKLNVADVKSGAVKDFYNLLGSSKWFSLMYDYTELDLHGRNAKSPSASIEFYRLTHGCYSLLNDRNGFFTDDSLDVILYFNSNPNFGFITYINPDEDGADKADSNDDDSGEDDDDDGTDGEEKNSVLLTVHPKDNALNIVYRSGHTGRFIKYVSKNRFAENAYVYLLVASYKE